MVAERLCPVCKRPGPRSVVRRERLPAMQNYVHRSLAEARAAKTGAFDLAFCEGGCGFAYNASFDPNLLDYDQGYDNRVPSVVMDEHYRHIALSLDARHGIANGLIVDVGCGKGVFLETACALFPGARGLGIDPTYEGADTSLEGRVRYLREFFASAHVTERPSVVVCRHVVEHIPDPVSFLRSIREAVAAYPDVPIVFEVPESSWILKNRVFWDFCYEHCNYFTPESLANALREAGFSPREHDVSYGGQYLSVEAVVKTGPAEPSVPPTSALCEAFIDYAAEESGLLARVDVLFDRLKTEGRDLALWGMATKGVVFAYLVDPDATRIDFCIDINTNKHNCHVPVTGHLIEGPEALRRSESGSLAILVMNPNYVAEIRETCRRLSLDAVFLDAHGNPL